MGTKAKLGDFVLGVPARLQAPEFALTALSGAPSSFLRTVSNLRPRAPSFGSLAKLSRHSHATRIRWRISWDLQLPAPNPRLIVRPSRERSWLTHWKQSIACL